MEEATPVDKYEQHIDLMNECRSFYYSRLQRTEHYKELCKTESSQQCTPTDDHSTLSSSIHRLQKEIVSLLDEDLSLMRQLLTLNENIEEMKNCPFQSYSKESFGSIGSGMIFLHSKFSENDVHLPTVHSESDLEQIPQQEPTIFEEIQSYVDDNKLDDKMSLIHQTSTDSGFMK